MFLIHLFSLKLQCMSVESGGFTTNTVSIISLDVFYKLSLPLSLRWTRPSLERRHSSSISTHFVCEALIRSIQVKVTPMCCKLKLSALLLWGTLYPWRLLLLSFPLATELSYGPGQKTTHDTIWWSLWWYRFYLLLACYLSLLILIRNVMSIDIIRASPLRLYLIGRKRWGSKERGVLLFWDQSSQTSAFLCTILESIKWEKKKLNNVFQLYLFAVILQDCATTLIDLLQILYVHAYKCVCVRPDWHNLVRKTLKGKTNNSAVSQVYLITVWVKHS